MSYIKHQVKASKVSSSCWAPLHKIQVFSDRIFQYKDTIYDIRFRESHKVTIKNAKFFVLIVSLLRTHQQKTKIQWTANNKTFNTKYHIAECDLISSCCHNWLVCIYFCVCICSLPRTFFFRSYSLCVERLLAFHRKHRLEHWLFDSQISQNMLGVLFANMIFEYLCYSSVLVWHFMLLNVLLWFAYLSLNAVSLNLYEIFVFEFSSFGVILALCRTILVRHFLLSGHWWFLTQQKVLAILSLGVLIIFYYMY